MEFYHLEPLKGFTHVLRAFTDVDHYVEVELMMNHTPLDCSEATGVMVTADKYSLASEAFDLSSMSEGILRMSFKGVPVGGYRATITVAFQDRTIVFGTVTVFVDDTGRSDDIAVFHQYPDTEDELTSWNEDHGITDGEGSEGTEGEETEEGAEVEMPEEGEGSEEEGTPEEGGEVETPDEGEGEDTEIPPEEGTGEDIPEITTGPDDAIGD